MAPKTRYSTRAVAVAVAKTSKMVDITPTLDETPEGPIKIRALHKLYPSLTSTNKSTPEGLDVPQEQRHFFFEEVPKPTLSQDQALAPLLLW